SRCAWSPRRRGWSRGLLAWSGRVSARCSGGERSGPEAIASGSGGYRLRVRRLSPQGPEAIASGSGGYRLRVRRLSPQGPEAIASGSEGEAIPSGVSLDSGRDGPDRLNRASALFFVCLNMVGWHPFHIPRAPFVAALP